jgi:hypothetical protein
VVCDRFVCAAGKNGVSVDLTRHYLGNRQAENIKRQGSFDTTRFTFANGIYCDTKERLCRQDRYFGNNGERSAVSPKYTKLLFPGR